MARRRDLDARVQPERPVARREAVAPPAQLAEGVHRALKLLEVPGRADEELRLRVDVARHEFADRNHLAGGVEQRGTVAVAQRLEGEPRLVEEHAGVPPAFARDVSHESGRAVEHHSPVGGHVGRGVVEGDHLQGHPRDTEALQEGRELGHVVSAPEVCLDGPSDRSHGGGSSSTGPRPKRPRAMGDRHASLDRMRRVGGASPTPRPPATACDAPIGPSSSREGVVVV